MSDKGEHSDAVRRRAVWDIVIYGSCCGLLIATLKFTEYRFLVVEHSVAIYGGMVAVLFASLGIWLGSSLTRKKQSTILADSAMPEVARVDEFGLTPRELEILGLMAEGLSNREIATKLFVSENTVKTHSRRIFEKLGAKRRTQAVQIGQAAGLIAAVSPHPNG